MFVIQTKKHKGIHGIYEQDVFEYARFLERKIKRLYKKLGIKRYPASGYKGKKFK